MHRNAPVRKIVTQLDLRAISLILDSLDFPHLEFEAIFFQQTRRRVTKFEESAAFNAERLKLSARRLSPRDDPTRIVRLLLNDPPAN